MDIAKLVGNVAPFLGGLIGGPFGAAAGQLIGQALTGNSNASAEDIEKAIINATPEQLVKLKELDNEYKTRLAELSVSSQQIEEQDRDSARKREISLHDYAPSLLAILLTFGFFGVIFVIMFIPIQEGVKDIINILLGTLGTAWIACINYYFGSSAETHNVTKILNQE